MFPLDLLERLNRIDPNEVAAQAIESTKPELVNLQEDQMMQGLNAKGEKIGRYRSQAYARRKNQMNPLPGFGVPDLRLTGSFHRGLGAIVQENSTTLTSDDSKADALAKKYGDIFGLSPQKLAEYRGVLQPKVVLELAKITGLKVK
jgi:hypothetical protein